MKRLIALLLVLFLFSSMIGCEPEEEMKDETVYTSDIPESSIASSESAESSYAETNFNGSSDHVSEYSDESVDETSDEHECSDYSDGDWIVAPEKPVIYLYPTEETEIEVILDYAGKITCFYPEYNGKWKITASPDGTLTDKDGIEYNYLYWEGLGGFESDFSEGFCIQGKDTAKFLEEALEMLGLSRREANEFIVYWLPKMQHNNYNLISFQFENYIEAAELTVTPKPDTSIRVFMSWKALDEEINISPQEFTSPQRKGFVLVEWGGTEVK